MDKIKDRAIRLIDYLIEIARLRSRIVREIDDYHRVLWLHEIPDEPKCCFTQAWGTNKEYDEDIWIEIKKYNEPILDEVPEICKKWVNESTLNNSTDIPELLSSITIQVEEQNPDADTDNSEQAQINVSKTLQLKDYPEVSKTWEFFIDSKWFPWAELHRRWQSVQNVYGKLFGIHQEQQKLGEEYELILGLGLLTWRTPSGQTVRRHLITAKAALTFDARLGKFTVMPAADGAQMNVEFDMLDIEHQPLKIRQTIQEMLLSSDDNPWDRACIDSVLNALANSLSDQGQGEYSENLELSQRSAQTKPIIEYAPALILRKRSLRGLEQTLHKMREQIEAGGEIPTEFIDICEGEVHRGYDPDNLKPKQPKTDQIIYFPKPYNEEQLQIIQKLQSSTGVLVQGPPGTGKSHTIANLICHLLAIGQRVLVTAKTPRALKVLHEQLPEQIRPLCINLLGSGIEEQRSLEASVSSILNEHERWNENRSDEKIEELERKIYELKKEKAELDYRIRSIRETETFQHDIIDGKYRGTAAKIALQLIEQSDEFEWLRDKIDYDYEFPLAPNETNALRAGLTLLNPDLEAELELIIPDPERDLPTQSKFEELVQLESEAKDSLFPQESLLNSRLGEALNQVEQGRISKIIDSVSKLTKAVESIRKRPMPWINEAVYEMLTDNDTPWKELLRILSEKLTGLKERAKKVSTQTLTVPNSFNRKKILMDAKELKKYFDGGGKPRWWIFKPKTIRAKKYLIEDVLIDGRTCNSSESLEMLIEDLSVQDQIDYCWKLWQDKTERKPGPIVLQVAELEELQEALTIVVEIYTLLEAAKESIRDIRGLGDPAWHNEETIHTLLNTCRAVIYKNDLRYIQQQLDHYITGIRSLANYPNAHAITKDVLSILVDRKVDKYPQALDRITQLRKLSDNAKLTKNLLKVLSESAPILVQYLLQNPKDEKWKVQLENLKQAWAWARASSWLRKFLNKEDYQSLERRSRQVNDDIRDNLAELSAIRAWKFCFNRMKESHRRHLMGWQQAMKKGGKFTGKHAHKHRRDAQRHLDECRDAVPAWIMPLHRVYDIVQPAPGIFDVIIVDEASQCGPESLPLTYLSKRLLVVGDDQQISPEAVGVDREQIHRLMDEYLNDFKHADSFDVESSLFDHAKRRFNNRIILREHFRCMPEIIRFSNDLSYSSTPLIPLRQYPPQRFEPLKRVHVVNGYREGSESRAINRSEAEEIVKIIVQCCNDDRYYGKTMGVIILQGDAQAALIESMLLKQLGAEEMEQRKLISGNPYSFQGDERDIIFLSMVAAPNHRIGSLTRSTDQRRFNVAASRAKDQMWLFHTATRNDLSEACLRRRLLEYFENPVSQISKALGKEAEELRLHAHRANRQIEKPPFPFDSWFELDVALLIAARGYRVVPQYPIAGKRIDLVIEGSKSQLAVECDGDVWHGPEQFEYDMARQRMLERCGWRFYRIRECAFNANPEEILKGLWRELDHLGISPIVEASSTNSDPSSSKNIQQNFRLESQEKSPVQLLFTKSL